MLAAALLGLPALAGGYGVQALVPPEGVAARGLVVDGVPVERGESIEDVVRHRLARRLGQRVRVVDGEQVLVEATLAELGARVDEASLRLAVAAVGRSGTLWRRLDDALEARRGHLAVALDWRLPIEPLAARLAEYKATRDRRARAARWSFGAGDATDHQDGQAVDVHETALAIERSLVDVGAPGQRLVPLSLRDLPPQATRAVVAAIDRSVVVASYETRFAFLGGQAGRAQNIQRAASAVDGLVLMPGEIVSFNAIVGPRSLDNGFAQAGEIYKGEMRVGVGGGTCQVASTLYSAAFFGGLEVVERSPHSRPSGYVPLGLDATVAYPHVDLRLRNPYAFPIVVHAVLEPGLLRFELQAERAPAHVDYAADTLKVQPYKRKIREAAWLAEGKVVRKQKGIRGLTVRKLRRIRYETGSERVEETTDVYPATHEIYLVSPGTDWDQSLPPLPEGVELDGAERGAKARSDREAPAAAPAGPTYPGEDEGSGQGPA